MLSEMFGVCESLPNALAPPALQGEPYGYVANPTAELLQLNVFGICGIYGFLNRPVILKPILSGFTASGLSSLIGFRKFAFAKTNSFVNVGLKMWTKFAL